MRTIHSAALPFLLLLTVGPTLALAQPSRAPDNQLTPQEKQEGWLLLFDGKSPAGWQNKDKTHDQPLPSANVEDGAINPHKSGTYVVYFKEPFDNFVLACDFKVSPGANSGIFIRTGDTNDPVQSGFEIQIFDSAGKPPGKHSCGALYDAVAPSTEASKPAGQWNHVEITADKNMVKVVLNDKLVVAADLDRWTEAGKNPDGTKNKFARALKDFPRSGYVGLQDHNAPVWFRNIRLKKLG